MRKIDTRVTKKRKLSAREYGEAVKEHYSENKQEERLNTFLEIVNDTIKSKKAEGLKSTTLKNLHQAVSLDSTYFTKLISEIENLGTKVDLNINTDEKKDEVTITWQ